MKSALLLVDVQNDFLERVGLVPESARLIAQIASLLARFRERGWPVFHIQTLVKPDGSDRMPHWKSQGHWACVEGTHGALPPPSLAPSGDESVIRKRSFSGFESGELHRALESRGVAAVVLAGLYTHACIRATAMDAYARGCAVRIAEDAVASTEPTHAQLSRQWMDRRGMRFMSSAEILTEVAVSNQATAKASRWLHYNPSCHSELLSETLFADADAVNAGVEAAFRAQAEWAKTPANRRAELLGAWAGILEADGGSLARLLAQEIGKPLSDADEEVGRAIAHIRATARLLMSAAGAAKDAFRVYDRPVGTVAIITPWNNPLAIPAGKIAPALAFGNGVVWKPALPASRTTEAIVEHLRRAGLPPDLLGVIRGDSETARTVISHPRISAVSFTGSNRAGDEVASLCSLLRKPLQAELGGNNAAIVLANADLALAAGAIAASAFGFAGQRCTATRRIIVEEAIRGAFLELLIAKVKGLVVGDPLSPDTQVGPLISSAHLRRVATMVERALAESHSRLLCGGASPPPGLSHGNWLLPTLIDGVSPDAPIVHDETFGPVAVVQVARDFEQAMALCNGVDAGLVASLFSRDTGRQQEFIQTAQAGILRINPQSFPVHPEAPFFGWKASGIGPPEHGRWDLEFYSRPQVVYGLGPGPCEPGK